MLLVGGGAREYTTALVHFESKMMNDYWDDWQKEALAAGVKAPLVLAHLDNVGAWLGFCESLTIALGAWALYVAIAMAFGALGAAFGG